MAGWSLFQNNAATGYAVGSKAVAYSSNIAAGSLLVASVNWSANNMSVSDSQNGAWTAIGSPIGPPLQLFYFSGAAAGSTTVTATLNTGTAAIELVILEYRGGSVGTVDGFNGASANATSLASGNFVTTGNSDLVVIGAAGNTRYPTQSNSGYTTRVQYVGDLYHVIFDNVSVPPGTQNVSISSNGSSMSLVLQTAGFLSVAPGVAGTNQLMLMGCGM